MKRRGVLLLTTIALLLVAGIAGVLAYYTDSERQNNRFQTATNKVEITEEFPPGIKPWGTFYKKGGSKK
ncbi:MAG: SipW-dependent-type signal peptide-containing protein [Lachnospiraceae bacterium]